MRDIKAVLLDSDGTLINTVEYIFRSYEYALGQCGAPQQSREFMTTLMGYSLEEIYRNLAPAHDLSLLCKLHREWQDDNMDLFDPYPRTVETLDALKQAGKKLAIVTSRPRNSAIKILKRVGVFDRVDVVLAEEDSENLKPHPEPLIKAMDLLGVTPEQTVMVGDMDVDVLAGKNAGTLTVGVTYGFFPHIAEYGPDHVIDDISELLAIAL